MLLTSRAQTKKKKEFCAWNNYQPEQSKGPVQTQVLCLSTVPWIYTKATLSYSNNTEIFDKEAIFDGGGSII